METDGYVRRVDLDIPPGQDESAFLAALLTAICRPSLPLAPGLIIRAPTLSGAGTGKGLLVRAISLIAFGTQPFAFTYGNSRGESDELEKRIGAALVEAQPVIFIDNVNAHLRSDLLASILTERYVAVRPLGTTQTRRLRPNAFVCATGNGMDLAEDLARRFLLVKFDAKTEAPEARHFPSGFLQKIEAQRDHLLSAALTIWRWGRQNDEAMPHGRPFGSYEEWARWVRDPLLALGCVDTIERVQSIKAQDPFRDTARQIFDAIWNHHQDQPFKASELHGSARDLIDPHGRSRQFVAGWLHRHVGTRIGEYTLTVLKGGKWGTATYALDRLIDDPPPMPPMIPMPSSSQEP